MSIFSRFTDIINSNLNSLLDKAENPEKMVRLIIQEMEDTIVEVRSDLAKILADKKIGQRQLEQMQKDIVLWQSKAEIALSKEREDLARAALQEKVKAQENVDVISAELSVIQEHIDKLQDEIAQLQTKLADAKARKNSLTLREKTADSRLKIKTNTNSQRINDALSKYERYEQKIDELEARVDVLNEPSSLATEIDELVKDESIEQELNSLKAKMKQSDASE